MVGMSARPLAIIYTFIFAIFFLCRSFYSVYKINYDDAGNSTTSESHVPRTIANGTCTTKRKNLAESTGVVPAKHPPKVKLELFSLL